MQLYCERSGSGERVLLLLHGMAGNAGVWRPLLDIYEGWSGKILAPDLLGHGRSPAGKYHGYGQHAQAVAELIEPGERVTVVAHSMGSAVALALATGWFGVRVESVLAFGVRRGFSDAEIEKSHAMSRNPPRWFETRAEAVERFLKLSGLTGLVAGDAPVVDAGVREEGGRWRVAASPGTFAAIGPEFGPMVQAARSPLRLACGSADPMVAIADLRRYDPEAIEIPGAGHNFHVHQPQLLVELMRSVFEQTAR